MIFHYHSVHIDVFTKRVIPTPIISTYILNDFKVETKRISIEIIKITTEIEQNYRVFQSLFSLYTELNLICGRQSRGYLGGGKTEINL
jgi:hypothetical protein